MKVIPYPEKRMPNPDEKKLLSAVASEYNLDSIEEQCFAWIIDKILSDSKALETQQNTGRALLDVGCGYFRYGRALHSVLSRHLPGILAYAVDKKRFNQDYGPAEFIKSDISEISRYLSEDARIISVFNPFPGIPDLSDVPRQKGCILIGCVDWNRTLFEKSMHENGFIPVMWLDNPFKELMVEWFNNYNPFVVAEYKGESKRF